MDKHEFHRRLTCAGERARLFAEPLVVESLPQLVTADENTLPRDIPTAVDESDPVEPFRIRGPVVPHGWRSVERDG